MVRAPCCEKMGLKKGPWSTEEDQILTSYINKHGHANWRALPKQAGLLRCGKSCRLRWINYLRQDIKRGNLTREEEGSIIMLHEKMGNRWSAIASYLPGRTDNEIKNVWHTHLKKRLTQNHPNSSKTKRCPTSTANAITLSDCRSTATMQSEHSSTSFATCQELESSACTNSTDFSSSFADQVSTKSIESNWKDRVNLDNVEDSLCIILPDEIYESCWSEAPPAVWDHHERSTVPSSDDERMQVQSAFENSLYGKENDNGMSFWYDLFVTAGDSLDLLQKI